ncbi:vWA domain-containing protein [Gilvimarinus xylanilyticus]|uniref:VWA domain-containing protein n=1 Tax=Gilvimarinus xylanilyticus TaxID=2944139 RepID=A0A9X2KSX7_9GAMM|nr:VWA domain-containing protein [Gilvimarinus xylanilyticus]MCP8898694.1 VWA domain-containing protein [Gilvimarinus xylanilyticus]
MFEFGLLWLLVLLPLPLIMRWVKPKTDSAPAVKVPFYHTAAELAGSSPLKRKRWGHGITLWLIWVLLVIAAADPRWIGEAQSQPYSGRDMMLAVDISKSMEIRDMLPPGIVAMQFQNGEPINRLTAVKAVVGDFVTRRTGDRLGLILFGDQAYVQAPLTYDTQTVNQLLQEAQIGFAGGATAIGDALGLAIKRLRERPEGSRRIILLSDGANTAGNTEPLEAARIAADMGVKVYTIGFGSNRSTGGFFSRSASADLDVRTLQQIAESTGGEFFRAESTEELAEVHKQLDALEPIELDERTVRPMNRLFYWPLGLALLLSALLAASRIHLRRANLAGGVS